MKLEFWNHVSIARLTSVWVFWLVGVHFEVIIVLVVYLFSADCIDYVWLYAFVFTLVSWILRLMLLITMLGWCVLSWYLYNIRVDCRIWPYVQAYWQCRLLIPFLYGMYVCFLLYWLAGVCQQVPGLLSSMRVRFIPIVVHEGSSPAPTRARVVDCSMGWEL